MIGISRNGQISQQQQQNRKNSFIFGKDPLIFRKDPCFTVPCARPEALHLHRLCIERADGTENRVSTAYMRP